MEYIQLTLFGKTFPEHSAQTEERISGEFSKKSQKPKFQYLKVENGLKADWSNYQTVRSLGELLTPSIGVFPNVAVESTLSQILEVNAPQKYYLSPKACQGILRRAEKRGKELPPLLKAALEAQAEGKFLVTNGSNMSQSWDGGRISPTLTKQNAGGNQRMPDKDNFNCVLQSEVFDMTHANDVIRGCGCICPALQARMGTGGNQIPIVFEPTYCIQGNTIERSDTAGANGKGVIEGESYTLNTVDHHAVCHSVGFCPNNSSTAAGLSEKYEKSPTLSVTKNVAACYPINTQVVIRSNKLGEGTGMGIGNDGDPAYTLQAAHSHGVIYAIDRAAFNQGENAKYDFQIDDSGINSTIVARGASAILDCRLSVWIVRRLTSRECERLQGFPDDWTLYDTSGNELKDTPRYKTLGNSIAIPCALRVFKGIAKAMAEQWAGNAKESEG